MILPLKRKASKKLEKIKHLPFGVGALPLSTDTFSRLFTLFIFLLHLNLIYVKVAEDLKHLCFFL